MSELSEDKGRFKVLVDCPQEIPCDPCVKACSTGAISMDEGMCGKPRITEGQCNGCLSCLEVCPVSCIYLMEKREGETLMTLALDRLPRLSKGDEVILKDGNGKDLGRGRVIKSRAAQKDKGLRILTLKVPAEVAGSVRTVEGMGTSINHPQPEEAEETWSGETEDLFICRCEEIERKELEEVIGAGVKHAPNLRRLTRVGLGLCQGRSCAQLLLGELIKRTGCDPEEASIPRARVPIRPVTIRELSGWTREA